MHSILMTANQRQLVKEARVLLQILLRRECAFRDTTLCARKTLIHSTASQLTPIGLIPLLEIKRANHKEELCRTTKSHTSLKPALIAIAAKLTDIRLCPQP
jgi:hypothetical protein